VPSRNCSLVHFTSLTPIRGPTSGREGANFRQRSDTARRRASDGGFNQIKSAATADRPTAGSKMFDDSTDCRRSSAPRPLISPAAAGGERVARCQSEQPAHKRRRRRDGLGVNPSVFAPRRLDFNTPLSSYLCLFVYLYFF